MFAYLRYFAIVSFVVVITASILIGVYFRSIATGDLMSVTERSSVSLAQSYINTTWQKHLPNIRRLSAIDASLWGKYREFRDFSEDTFRQFEGVPVTRVNLYTPQGAQVLTVSQDAEIESTADSAIKELPTDDSTRMGFDAALKGSIYSNVIENRTFKSRTGEQTQGTVVQTFIPIMPDSFVPVLAGAPAPKVEGVLEIFYDITPQWSQLYLFQVLGTGGIMLIFVILIGVLLFTSKKAESIITNQHETNVELAAAAAKAEAESRQKSQFLANVSHELRTPLNAIIGFSEIIKNEVMGALANEQYMAYIRDIHSSGVHLLSLINDILDFSKAEAGKLELQLSELDATKLIKNCMRLVGPRAEEAGVTLTTEIPKEHFIITGDAKKLKQVLLNLLSNSVKFTPQGGEVRVTAWQNVMDDSISIEVKDSGIGIAPKDISRAMSPFGQVDSALSRKYEGTGLGLPLTKKFVEIMGGTFKIESELNVGTTITITIPLTPPKHVLTNASKIAVEDADDSKREKQISPGLLPKGQFDSPAEEAPAPLPKPPLTGLQAKPPLFAQPAQPTPSIQQEVPPISHSPVAQPVDEAIAAQPADAFNAPPLDAPAQTTTAPAAFAETPPPAFTQPEAPQPSRSLLSGIRTPEETPVEPAPAAPTAAGLFSASSPSSVQPVPANKTFTGFSSAAPNSSTFEPEAAATSSFNAPSGPAAHEDAHSLHSAAENTADGVAIDGITPPSAYDTAPMVESPPEAVPHSSPSPAAASSGSGLKFASYEEWKRMQQNNGGGNNNSSGQE